MKKILWEVYNALRRFQIFVIDSKIHQTLHFYLKSTKTNRPGKVTRVLSGNFIESSTTLLNRARLYKCSSKYAQQTCFNESKLWKQICIKLTSILFEEVPKSTELLLWGRGQSLDNQLPACRSTIFAVTLSQIISSFCLAVGFWEAQSIKSQHLQITDCVLNEYFQNFCSSNSAQNIFIRNVLALSCRPVAMAIL